MKELLNKKILIVDDDTNICELLRLYIEKEGYEASIANDGETALCKGHFACEVSAGGTLFTGCQPA